MVDVNRTTQQTTYNDAAWQAQGNTGASTAAFIQDADANRRNGAAVDGMLLDQAMRAINTKADRGGSVKLLATTGIFPTAPRNGNFNADVLFTIADETETGWFVGTGQPDIGVQDGADPGDGFVGLKFYGAIRSGTAPNYTYARHDAGVVTTVGDGQNYTLPFNATATVILNGQYEPERNNWRIRIQGNNQTIPANAVVLVYAMYSDGSKGEQGEKGDKGDPGDAGADATVDRLEPTATLPNTDPVNTIRNQGGDLYVENQSLGWDRKALAPHGGTAGQVATYDATGDLVAQDLPLADGSTTGMIQPDEYALIHSALDTAHLDRVPEVPNSGIELRDDVLFFDRSVTVGQQVREISFAELNKRWVEHAPRTDLLIDGLANGVAFSSQTLMRIGTPSTSQRTLSQMMALDWGQTSIADISPAVGPIAHIPVRILKSERSQLHRYRVVVEGDHYEFDDPDGSAWTHVGDDDAQNVWSYYSVAVPSPGIGAGETILVEKTPPLTLPGDITIGTPSAVNPAYFGTNADGTPGNYPLLLPVKLKSGNLAGIAWTGQSSVRITGSDRAFDQAVDLSAHEGIIEYFAVFTLSSPSSTRMGFTSTGPQDAVVTTIHQDHRTASPLVLAAPRYASNAQNGILLITQPFYDGNGKVGDLKLYAVRDSGSDELTVDFVFDRTTGSGSASFACTLYAYYTIVR